jgi:hypothetical protein
MLSLGLLRSYTTWENITAAVKNPRATFQTLKAVSFDISRVCSLLSTNQGEFNHYIEEVRSNQDFISHISRKLKDFESRLKQEGLDTGIMGSPLAGVLYAIIRSLSPEVVLETGVASGVSSAYILLALEENRKGKLFSIDLPSQRWPLPEGEQPGWLIPKELKHRWTLRLGRSSDVLPGILEQLKSVDIFLHDSERSYENMKWEYQVVWPYVKYGGLLLSHDIDANEAFPEFCKETKAPKFIYSGRFGGIVKK